MRIVLRKGEIYTGRDGIVIQNFTRHTIVIIKEGRTIIISEVLIR